MGKVMFKRDLFFAALAALIIHLGIALCRVSISSPLGYLQAENQRPLEIMVRTRMAEAEKPQVLPVVNKKKRVFVEEEKKIVEPDISSKKKKSVEVKKVEPVPIVEVGSVISSAVTDSTSLEKEERKPIGSPNSKTNMSEHTGRVPETAVDITAAPRYGENAPPVYPMIARRNGYEGMVLLSAEVLSDGRAGQVRLKKSSGYAVLDKSALQAVKKWKFEPARRKNTPVVVWVNVPVKFVLRDN
ncbi:MAG: TonB family protein [Syntrophales bacterium]